MHTHTFHIPIFVYARFTIRQCCITRRYIWSACTHVNVACTCKSTTPTRGRVARIAVTQVLYSVRAREQVRSPGSALEIREQVN